MDAKGWHYQMQIKKGGWIRQGIEVEMKGWMVKVALLCANYKV